MGVRAWSEGIRTMSETNSETNNEESIQEQPNPERANYQPETPGGIPTPTKDAPAEQATKPARPVPGAPSNVLRGRVETIHYTLSYAVLNPERGTRGAIVLLHDLPGGAFVWEPLMTQLATTGRAVYAFDLLGYGRSDKPWPSDTSIWGHADALIYAFQGLRLADIVLVGVGLGGGVAQVLANRLYREGVAKLVLIDTYAYSYAFAPNWPMPDMAAHQDPEAAHHAKLEDVLNDLRTTLPNGSAKPKQLSAQRIAQYVDEWNSDVGKHLLYQHIRLMMPTYMNSVSSDNARLEIPVLILWGQEDSVTPLAYAERLRDEIPGAQLDVIPNAGHLILEDAPDAVASKITAFAGPLE